MTTLVEVSASPPCPGRLDALLEFASLDPHERRAQPATQRHVNQCHACRGFVDTISRQRRLVPQTTYPSAPSPQAGEMPVDLAPLRDWLNRAVRWHSEQKLAAALDRIAQSLLRMDAEVRQTFYSDPRNERSPEESARFLTEALQRLDPSKLKDGTLPALLVQATPWIMTHARRQDRRALAIRQLAQISQALDNDRHSPAFYRLALLEWYYGNEKLVGDLLSNSELTSISHQQRAESLTALCIWHVDRGELRECLTNGVRVLIGMQEHLPQAILVRLAMNLSLWHGIAGHTRQARLFVRGLLDLVGRAPITRVFPRPLTARVLTHLGRLYEVPARRLNRIAAHIDTELYRDGLARLPFVLRREHRNERG